ncbi:MAG: TerB family tellurite resistance protein [Kofleriaceae bacterium]
MAIADRILPLTRLLLGAAYADNEVHDKEREEVRALLEDLAGELPTAIELEIVKFDPKSFDLALTAGEFVGDSEDDRKKLLFLVSAVIEADEEIDFSEDDYLRKLAGALKLPASALAGLTVDVETEDLKETFQQVRKGPPPPPKSAKKSFDIDLD